MPQDNPAAIPGEPLRILLVEDDLDFQQVFCMLLELEGHEVEVAGNGPLALELIAWQKPDVAFIDLGLPGMDGCEVARTLRNNPECRRVFLAALTGYDGREDIAAIRLAGFDRHLVKPVAIDQVRRLLRELPAWQEARQAQPQRG